MGYDPWKDDVMPDVKDILGHGFLVMGYGIWVMGHGFYPLWMSCNGSWVMEQCSMGYGLWTWFWVMDSVSVY
jgi:hypothetical protein